MTPRVPSPPPRASTVTVLCGGFGAARFVPGLAATVGHLRCIVNTADDLERLGVHISPDVDAVSYALAGFYDEERGWGVTGDTFTCVDALSDYGEGWFRIGDRDLARSLLRTRLLAEGRSLSEATAWLNERLGLHARVLPMTDRPVRSMVLTTEGRLTFQDYLVRRRAKPDVVGLDYEGAVDAGPAPGVVEAISDADLLVVAPSSPAASIGPILSVEGIRRALRCRSGPTVAVSPVVSGQVPRTPPEMARAAVRAGFMAAIGLAHRAASVALLYQGLIDGFVLDQRDAGEQEEIEAVGIPVLLADTLAGPSARTAMAAQVVRYGRSLSCSTRLAMAPGG